MAFSAGSILPALAAAVPLLLTASTAHAQDIFEIQVYDSQVATPMRPGIETHLNYTNTRETARNGAGELPTDAVGRITFEPHLGLTPWAEAGMYFITAIRPEGAFDFVGAKLRLKLRWPERLLGETLGLSLNQEIGFVSSEYEAAQVAWEIRPIIDFRYRWFYASFNPIVGVDLAGNSAGQVEAEPALKVALSPLPWLAIGPEYFAGLGPLFAFSPLSEQRHWLFGALDFSGQNRTISWDVNVALGHGLIGPDDWILKAIVGIDLN